MINLMSNIALIVQQRWSSCLGSSKTQTNPDELDWIKSAWPPVSFEPLARLSSVKKNICSSKLQIIKSIDMYKVTQLKKNILILIC